MPRPNILLCTVGTSLFRPNLLGLESALREGKLEGPVLAVAADLVAAHRAADWPRVAELLGQLPPAERLCGAEVNSVASLLDKCYAAPDCGLFFFHSATADGRAIARVLTAYYDRRGHAPVHAVEVDDLQDADPKRFRTHGLRNLAKAMCRVIRDHSPAACAINSTGGYKAQIAVAVLLGQALGVPVYYKHELFAEIIAFPPLPVALDFEFWMKASGLLYDLEGRADPAPAAEYADAWDERCESLVERVEVDGQGYLELSATGQIFHETFREKFRSARDQVLPPPVPARQKQAPSAEHGHLPGLKGLLPYLQSVTAEVPQVARCYTYYHHPSLPGRPSFRLGSRGIEGVWSDGTATVKFGVETSAQTEGQRAAVVAALNEWLRDRG